MYAKTQKHGFGFVAIAPDSVAYGRYKDPDSYVGFDVKNIPAFLRADGQEDGQLPDTSNILIAHGRTSTNAICPQNVHPFRKDNLFLAHNGQVEWLGKKSDEPRSIAGCDSEQLLNWLAAGNSWEAAHDAWGGWGAVMLADATIGQMCIAVGSGRLYCAKRAYGKGWVFATDDDDLVWICRQSAVKLATRPIKIPTHLIYIGADGGIEADAEWAGFGSRNVNAMFQHAGHGGCEVTLYKNGKKYKKRDIQNNGIPEYRGQAFNGGLGAMV